MEVALKPRRPDRASTWRFIRTRLLTTGGDYCYHVWQLFCEELIEVHNMKPPKYESFKKYWYVLKKLGLIEPVGKPIKGKSGKPRQLYRIVPGKEDERMWPSNPQAALYGDKVKLGRRRYRRRVLKIPPLPVGRPPKSE